MWTTLTYLMGLCHVQENTSGKPVLAFFNFRGKPASFQNFPGGGVERYYSLPERIYREYAQRQDSINSEF